ncbi:MAG: hypothetical protein R3C24_02190 [Cyanobacteriota/Melainabacteria group bacterium]
MPERGEGKQRTDRIRIIAAKIRRRVGSDGALKADAKLAREAWAETRTRHEHPRLLAEAVSLNGSKNRIACSEHDRRRHFFPDE